MTQTCSPNPPSPFLSSFCSFLIWRSNCRIKDPHQNHREIDLDHPNCGLEVHIQRVTVAYNCPLEYSLPPQGKKFWLFSNGLRRYSIINDLYLIFNYHQFLPYSICRLNFTTFIQRKIVKLFVTRIVFFLKFCNLFINDVYFIFFINQYS